MREEGGRMADGDRGRDDKTGIGTRVERERERERERGPRHVVRWHVSPK